MPVIDRIVSIDFQDWDAKVQYYEQRIKNLPVPRENNTTTLFLFNQQIDEILSTASYDYARARSNKESIEAFLESIFKDYYEGANESARKAAGIQYARHYPAPDEHHSPFVNLYDIRDQLFYYFYMMSATISALTGKRDAKITNNALLKLETDLM